MLTRISRIATFDSRCKRHLPLYGGADMLDFIGFLIILAAMLGFAWFLVWWQNRRPPEPPRTGGGRRPPKGGNGPDDPIEPTGF